ncbi:MAG: glycerophosphodiester phosphodiesterase [Promethearchaeota archaeon]
MNNRKILISGHRGYNKWEIENTEKAFLRAMAEGIDYVEFDVKSTNDHVPVVFHDESLRRLLGVNRIISRVSFPELKGYKFPDGQHVLSLEEFFNLIDDKIHLMLEIKSKHIEREVCALIKKYDLEERTIIQSFNGSIIKRCYRIEPGIRYGLCMGALGNIGPLGTYTKIHYLIGAAVYLTLIHNLPVKYLNLDGPFIFDEFIRICIQKGKRIILGARNTWNYLDKIEEWNVEIVNADDPSYIRSLLERRGYSFR